MENWLVYGYLYCSSPRPGEQGSKALLELLNLASYVDTSYYYCTLSIPHFVKWSYNYMSEEVGHGHMTVHVIKSYVWESHMKPFSHRVAA